MPRKSKVQMEDEFKDGYSSGMEAVKRIIDNHLMHRPTPPTMLECFAFLLNPSLTYARIHRELIEDIDRSIDNLTNDLP